MEFFYAFYFPLFCGAQKQSMGLEIERKFTVDKALWQAQVKPKGLYLKQTYLSTDPEKTIRVRILGDKGFFTVKGKMEGLTRSEYEYEIPKQDASEMIDRFGDTCIEKTRYLIEHEGHTWEVDEFHGANNGLIIAELELESESTTFSKPIWIDEEVSTDARYFNSNLQENPYTLW